MVLFSEALVIKAYYIHAVTFLGNLLQPLLLRFADYVSNLTVFGTGVLGCVNDPMAPAIGYIVDSVCFLFVATSVYQLALLVWFSLSSLFWVRSYLHTLWVHLGSGAPGSASAASDAKAARFGETTLAEARSAAIWNIIGAFLLYRIKPLITLIFSLGICLANAARTALGGAGFIEDSIFAVTMACIVFIMLPPLFGAICRAAVWILSSIPKLFRRRAISNIVIVDGDELDVWDGVYLELDDGQAVQLAAKMVECNKTLESITANDLHEYTREFATFCVFEARDGKDHKNKRGRGAPLHKIASRLGGGNILRKKRGKRGGRFRLADSDYQDYLDAVRDGYRGTPIEWAAANGRSVVWVSDSVSDGPSAADDPSDFSSVPPPLYSEPRAKPGEVPKPRFAKFTAQDRESFKRFASDQSPESAQASSPAVTETLKRAAGVLWIDSPSGLAAVGNIHRSPKGPYYISAMHERGTLEEIKSDYFVSASPDAPPSAYVQIKPLTPWHETASDIGQAQDWCIWEGPKGCPLPLEAPCHNFFSPPKGEHICQVVQWKFDNDHIVWQPHAGKIGIQADSLIHLAETKEGSSGSMICIRQGDNTVPIGIHCAGGNGKNHGVYYYPHVVSAIDRLLGLSYPSKTETRETGKEKVKEGWIMSCGPEKQYKCPCPKNQKGNKCPRIPCEPEGWTYCAKHEHKCVNRSAYLGNDELTPGRSEKGITAPPRFGAKLTLTQSVATSAGTSGA